MSGRATSKAKALAFHRALTRAARRCVRRAPEPQSRQHGQPSERNEVEVPLTYPLSRPSTEPPRSFGIGDDDGMAIRPGLLASLRRLRRAPESRWRRRASSVSCDAPHGDLVSGSTIAVSTPTLAAGATNVRPGLGPRCTSVGRGRRRNGWGRTVERRGQRRRRRLLGIHRGGKRAWCCRCLDGAVGAGPAIGMGSLPGGAQSTSATPRNHRRVPGRTTLRSRCGEKGGPAMWATKSGCRRWPSWS